MSEEKDNIEEINEEEQFDAQQEEYHDQQISHEELLQAHKISFKDVADHAVGPTISVVLHIILLTLIASIIVFEAPKEKADITVEVTEVEVKELEEIPEPPQPPEEVSDAVVDVEIERPDVSSEPVDIEVDDVAVEDVVIDDVMPELTSVQPNSSALKLPGVYKGRTGSGRKSLVKKYGGSVHTEKSVDKGLDWLAKVQNPDGSWGTNTSIQVPFTALATLCFLARGETPMSPKYGETLIKAISKLVEYATYMVVHKRPYIGNGSRYDHPIVAYALSEAYGITGMPRVQKAMNATIEKIVEGINKNGSFYYNYSTALRLPHWTRDRITGKYPKNHKYTDPYSDLTFAGWNYQALKAAYVAGCDVKGLDEAMDKCIEGMKHHYRPGTQNFGDVTLTSVGLLCMGLFGAGNSPEAKAAKKWFTEINKKGNENCYWRYTPEYHEKYPNAFRWALYTWYYQTQTLFQISKGKGRLWNSWNSSFSRAFVREQNDEGYWSSPAEKYGQSLDKKINAEWSHIQDFKNPLDLHIYATTICVLSLEVYYRYLPTFKLKPRSTAKQDNALNDDDIKILIE